MEGFFQLSKFHKRTPVSNLTPKCGACGLFKTCQSPKMKPWGEGRTKILIVGEAPGKQEDEAGRPFVGLSGQLLRSAIGRIGLNFQEDFLITNAIICRPPGNKMPQDGKEVAFCRANILTTIAKFKPTVIITLGKWALHAILPQFWKGDIGPLERWVGHTIPTKDFWICPTYHPSFILREKDKNKMVEPMWIAHLEKACKLQFKAPAPLSLENKVTRLFDEREIYQAIRKFDEAGRPCGFDYETNCLKPEYPKARIYTASISDGDTTIAYPFFGKAIIATSMFLKSSRCSKIAGNGKFENRWTMFHLGHIINRLNWDTFIGAHCIDNRTGVCSLKFQAFVQFGVETYNEAIEPFLGSSSGSHYNRIHEIEMGQLLDYNGGDSYLEKRLSRRQQKALGFIT
jgi:uracil-DNA glycosylase family 4